MSQNQNMQKYLIEYIKANKGEYTRDAITKKLISAGYSNKDIDDAYDALGMEWNTQENEGHSGVRSDDWRSASANPIGFLIFFPGIPILIFLLILLAIFPEFPETRVQLISYLYIGTLISGMFVPMFVEDIDPGLAKGMIYGYRTFLVLFLCLPIVAQVVILGICLVNGGGEWG